MSSGNRPRSAGASASDLFSRASIRCSTWALSSRESQPRSIRTSARGTVLRAAHTLHASTNWAAPIRSACSTNTPNRRLRSVSVARCPCVTASHLLLGQDSPRIKTLSEMTSNSRFRRDPCAHRPQCALVDPTCHQPRDWLWVRPPFKPCMRISRTRLTRGSSGRGITQPPDTESCRAGG